jgi:hypothetical protein
MPTDMSQLPSYQPLLASRHYRAEGVFDDRKPASHRMTARRLLA